ncbi:MAG: hypothetical protein OEY47_01365 [Candidatus Bathyarchaeota archaeon]|nr:hypothetical protein [Candidatus Bathyarchaeota archaeon]
MQNDDLRSFVIQFKEKSKVLMGSFHVIGITHKSNIYLPDLNKYKKATSWRQFKQNPARRKYFNPEFLHQVVNLVHSLNYYMSELGEVVYFLKKNPLLISLDDFFIVLSPCEPLEE